MKGHTGCQVGRTADLAGVHVRRPARGMLLTGDHRQLAAVCVAWHQTDCYCGVAARVDETFQVGSASNHSPSPLRRRSLTRTVISVIGFPDGVNRT
jgi:hypothetical protein